MCGRVAGVETYLLRKDGDGVLINEEHLAIGSLRTIQILLPLLLNRVAESNGAPLGGLDGDETCRGFRVACKGSRKNSHVAAPICTSFAVLRKKQWR